MRRSILTAALLILGPLQAHAVLISSSVGDYNVTTITGTVDSEAAVLTSQVWYGDFTLAEEFAVLVGNSLGQPNSYSGETLSPLFAYYVAPGSLFDADFTGNACIVSVCTLGGVSTASWVWAVAEPVQSVPEPTTLSLLAAGLLGFAFMRRRRIN